MDKVAVFWGVARHALGIAGGAIIALGLTTSADWTSLLTSIDGIVGGLAVVVAVGASILNKVKGFNLGSFFGKTGA